MTAALLGAVELLERSLAYTRAALAAVEGVPGTSPTPCRGWPLARLLAHMEDALDAYAESSTGRMSLAPTADRSRLDSIRVKACDLLAWWLEDAAEEVRIAGRALPSDLLVGAAALEIALHGWDLHDTAGRRVGVPEELAAALLEVARGLPAGDRAPCFAPPVPVAPSAPDSQRLLGFLGRT